MTEDPPKKTEKTSIALKPNGAVTLTPNNSYIEDIDKLLSEPRQLWLLGAGISLEAGIPLMYPLTDRVEAILKGAEQAYYKYIRSQLPAEGHVEHILSHLGDLIAIANRLKERKYTINTTELTVQQIESFHSSIQEAIRETVQWGYRKADTTSGKPEEIGNRDKPIVSNKDHERFVRALFLKRRAGLEHRPPIAIFTTNYDTLIEDSLALSRVSSVDGFNGGSMAFWNPDDQLTDFDHPFSGHSGCKLYKLHGSIDWFMSKADIVVRRREWTSYPDSKDGKLLIYPQSTKYLVTQKDPFARLFSALRNALCDSEQSVLCVCGYSFGDEHINEEIERALRQRGNPLTVLAFVSQAKTKDNETGLPDVLNRWLRSSEEFKDRIIVAGKTDIFHGSEKPKFTTESGKEFRWWKFQGLTDFLEFGPEIIKKDV